MSGQDEEKGFLSRWSERKREAAQPKSEVPEKTAEEPKLPAVTDDDAEEAFDLSSLPKLEEITANTDIATFLRKGVPDGLRNAALRKFWALDPAIRNYVNPALDYAYDWNTPGGVPGNGEIAAGTDIAKMVRQIMGSDSGENDSPPQNTSTSGEDVARVGHERPEIVAPQDAEPDFPPRSVRLSEATSPAKPEIADSEVPNHSAGSEDASAKDSSASQQKVRRHGTAKPRV